jgi:hypothetical protein
MTLWSEQNHKIKFFSMGDTIFWFPLKGIKEHTKNILNGALIRIKYNLFLQ